MWQGYDIIVTVSFIQSCEDLRELLVDRGVVAHAPVEEGVGPCSVGYEMGGAAGKHDTNVLIY